jgi:pimeloyl-ACP methyl ester carboxylesterase
MHPTLRLEPPFEYIEEGHGQPLLLLHGLFGALSNWQALLNHFSAQYRVLIPLLPITKNTHEVKPTVEGLASYVHAFWQYKQLGQVTLLGNSLGGHVALVYALMYPHNVTGIVLTGSSGLFEAGMGQGMPRRGDYQYLQERVAFTFYDPAVATKELVDEVHALVNNRMAAIRIVNLARNAQRTNMRVQVRRIQAPTCLIWGLNDNITPTYVAHEFNRLIPNSELHFIDRCGHAAMMERPEAFNAIVANFLRKSSVSFTLQGVSAPL